MKGKALNLWPSLILAALLAACGAAPGAAPPDTLPAVPAASFDLPASGNSVPFSEPDAFERPDIDALFSTDLGWPDYLPDDIPPLPADIWLVQADQYYTRIWFRNLQHDDFLSYLALLKNSGYSLAYVIYEQPGVTITEDEKERLAAEGKFDAVRITKGVYSFYIEYGGNEGTYDLNTSDFMDPGAVRR